MRLVSIWLGSFGCLPKHLFGFVRPRFLDVTHTAGGSDAMVEEKEVEGVENKAINVIGCLDRGQREDRRSERGGRDGGTDRGRGRLSSSLLSALWRGQEDAKSVGCLSTGSQRVCEYPSVYLSVPICVHLSICPVFAATLYMCVWRSA